MICRAPIRRRLSWPLLRSLLISLLLATWSAFAQASDALQPRDATLGNGLSVRVIEDHALPLVSVSLMVPGGAIHDPEDRGGVATLTGRLLCEGTQDMSALELAEQIEQLGSELEVQPAAAFTTISADFLPRDLVRGLELMAEVLAAPRFAAEDFEQERDRALAELADDLEQPAPVATRVLYRQLFADHPYGRPESGTTASLQAVQLQDVKDFHQARYRPRGAVLAVVGDVKARQVQRQAELAFRRWRGRAARAELAALPAPWQGERRVVCDLPGQTQAQIRVARRTIPRAHRDHLALRMANAVAGGGFTSRLMQEIRVERSLSYGASSSLYSFADVVVFQARTFTANETLAEALGVMRQVVDDWRQQPWQDEEFSRARNCSLGMLPQVLETRASRAWSLTLLDYYGLPADDLARRADAMAAIDRGRAQEAAGEHLGADGWLVVVVGDVGEIEGQLEGFEEGAWEVVGVE